MNILLDNTTKKWWWTVNDNGTVIRAYMTEREMDDYRDHHGAIYERKEDAELRASHPWSTDKWCKDPLHTPKYGKPVFW